MQKNKILDQIQKNKQSTVNPFVNKEYELFPHTFAQYYSQSSANGRIWKPYWYLKHISVEIVKAITQEGHSGLMVSLPPRHGKSEFLSVWTPLWFLCRFPGKKVAVATYSDDFSAKWGARIRDEIQDNERINNIYLKKGAKGKQKFQVKYNSCKQVSQFLGVGTTGGFSGKGFHLGIIDDAIKDWKDAYSAQSREDRRYWYDSVYTTRAEPDATSIILMTRYKEDDLFNYIKKSNPEYKVLRFPAIKDDLDNDEYYNEYDDRDIGEPLNPQRKRKKELMKIKDSVHTKVWNATFQQKPIEQTKASAFLWDEDSIDNCHLVEDRNPDEVAKELSRIIVSVDPSGSRQGDEVGITVQGKKYKAGQNEGYVLANYSGHYSPEGWARVVQNAYDRFQADCVVGEKNFGGDMVKSNIRSFDKSINVKLVTATRGKTVRAEPVVGLYERSLITHVKHFDKLEHQMLKYDPDSTHNSPDRMDAMVWGFTELLLGSGDYNAGFF